MQLPSTLMSLERCEGDHGLSLSLTGWYCLLLPLDDTITLYSPPATSYAADDDAVWSKTVTRSLGQTQIVCHASICHEADSAAPLQHSPLTVPYLLATQCQRPAQKHQIVSLTASLELGSV